MVRIRSTALPAVSYAAVQKVPYGVDELSVARGLAGEAIRTVKCKTVPLVVPETGGSGTLMWILWGLMKD